MDNFETIREQALSLSLEERERLVEDLLSSCNPEEREAIEKVWADEIESRSMAYRAGQISTVTLEESRRRMGL